jgi:hypothetical protein
MPDQDAGPERGLLGLAHAEVADEERQERQHEGEAGEDRRTPSRP